jgi:hypothetical protein
MSLHLPRSSKAEEIPPLEARLTESLRAFERGQTCMGVSELANAVVVCFEHPENIEADWLRAMCARITVEAGWPEAQ